VTLPKFIVFYGEGSDGVLATKMKEEEGCPEDLEAVVADLRLKNCGLQTPLDTCV
jgi:hypothetical protein